MTPVWNLHTGDCLKVMGEMESDSIDAIVTDPPYGISYMSKRWDYDVPSEDVWKEALRIVKPGGHALIFGGSRTFHRTVLEIEEAGWEIRDQIAWIYGQGFPKSVDISKEIDSQLGMEREIVGWKKGTGFDPSMDHPGMPGKMTGAKHVSVDLPITAPNSLDAKAYHEWGTGLRPSLEPICLARKPLESTLAKNVMLHGTGAMNIGGTRIPNEQGIPERWPSNVILDPEASNALNAQMPRGSRFFYCAKPSIREREEGLGKLTGLDPTEITGRKKHSAGQEKPRAGMAESRKRKNHHPTVKPVSLMRYLCRLITPAGGTVLDPYMGSGTTGIGAILEGFDFVGIDRDPRYIEIAQARLKYHKFYLQLAEEGDGKHNE